MNENILLDLNTCDATSLVLEPSLSYDNILQRNFNIYKFVTGKNRWKMLHLNKPSNMLQPKTSCDEWNPNINFKLRPHELETCEWEINGEQCPDAFDEDCFRNLKAAPGEAARFTSLLGLKPEYQALELAMMMRVREGLTDDIFKVAWFGNVNFSEIVEAGNYDLSHKSPKEIASLTRMMENCNGWWSEIKARAHLKDGDYGKVRYVNTNNGTAQGNAMNPSNIKAYLDRMKSIAHPILGLWNLKMARSEWPCYFLQKGLFDALVTCYESQNCLQDCSLIYDGLPVPGATTYKGHPVFMMAEWTMWDYETGAMDPNTGYSKHQRALFSAKENLCGISNMMNIDGRVGSTLVIERDPSLKAKGKKYIYGCIGLGFGIAQPILMVAGWNSSFDYK